MTDAIRNSGLIVCHLRELETNLEYYLAHPEALAEKRGKARESILRLHDNDVLAARLISLYETAHILTAS